MHIWGLHVIDAFIIVLYFVAMIWIGKRLSARMTNIDEFYLAGRRMGRIYQFFLNFGASTDASQAAALSREIYRQGIAGMWIQYLVLFLTPFYWFTAMLFELLARVRKELVLTGSALSESVMALAERVNRSADAYLWGGSDQHVAPFACRNDIVALDGFDARVAVCVRQYRMFGALYDMALSVVSVNQERSAAVSDVRLRGVEYEAGMKFIKRFLGALQWKP